MLSRARDTATCLIDAWGQPRAETIALWQLNERHLGALQGLDKQAIRDRWGNAQRHRWRSDFAALPPPLDRDDPRHPRHDPRYRHLPGHVVPGAERIEDLRRRVLGVWNAIIASDLAAGRHVAVVAHRDSLRVLISALESVQDSRFADIDVPPAYPRIYAVRGKPRIDFSAFPAVRSPDGGQT
jgi:2,3-bisphosphoglycerate-dependent phosphoglycerate mutase